MKNVKFKNAEYTIKTKDLEAFFRKFSGNRARQKKIREKVLGLFEVFHELYINDKSVAEEDTLVMAVEMMHRLNGLLDLFNEHANDMQQMIILNKKRR